MIDWIPGLAADVIGLIGTACVLAAFAYINSAKAPNGVLFNAVNLIGALLLMISLLVHFNLASFLLEIAWASIAIWGLAKALRRGREGAA